MPAFFQHPVVRRCRVLFRWCRITVWLIVLLLVGLVAYLHMVGLPEFLKGPLLHKLQEQGINARFSNMQIGWTHGPALIIENPAFSRFAQPLSPLLAASRAELALNWDALRHREIRVRSIQVAGAQVVLPVADTNGDALQLNNVGLNLEFDSNDVVQLHSFRGNFRGIQIDLIAAVTHASALRQWKFTPVSGETNGSIQGTLQEISRLTREIHVAGTPVLQIEAHADAADINSFHAEMTFAANAAQTPWGEVTNFYINAACAHMAAPGQRVFLQAECNTSSLVSPWGRTHKLAATVQFSHTADSNLYANIKLDANRITGMERSNFFSATSLNWNGGATLSASNLSVLSAQGTLNATDLHTPLGVGKTISLSGRAERLPASASPAPEWGWWNWFSSWKIDGQANLRAVFAPKLRVQSAILPVHWQAPTLTVDRFQIETYPGQAQGKAALNIASRKLEVSGTGDFDPRLVSPFLVEPARRWIAQLDWTNAPKTDARLSVILPPWTNRPVGWQDAANKSFALNGNFVTTGPASFRKIPVDFARGHVEYENLQWNITDLHAVRPDGNITLGYRTSSNGFHYSLNGAMNPKVVLPLLPPKHQHVLDDFDFPVPPVFQVEISGPWNQRGSPSFAATVQATNFIARGEPVAALNAKVDFTNQLLSIHDFFLSNRQCRAQAPFARVNLTTKMVNVTNLTGQINPAVLTRVLRANSPEFLDQVHFDTPATVAISGSYSLTNQDANDLHFAVSGQSVHYNGMLADNVAGDVFWVGRVIAITNVAASLYHGTVNGSLVFDTPPGGEQQFDATLLIRNLDLPSLITGFTGKTNKIEGHLDADIALAGPNSADKNQWRGHGRIYVHDALLWDIKLFGLLSPVLNAISPGAGNSRAREATATFGIRNGDITTDNLAIHATAFRVNYRGTISFDKKINARVEASLLREMPLLGPLFSLVLSPFSKLFEYRVKGTLKDPVMEPIFIPKFLLDLLHPIKSLKNAAAPKPASSSSQPPPTAP